MAKSIITSRDVTVGTQTFSFGATVAEPSTGSTPVTAVFEFTPKVVFATGLVPKVKVRVEGWGATADPGDPNADISALTAQFEVDGVSGLVSATVDADGFVEVPNNALSIHLSVNVVADSVAGEQPEVFAFILEQGTDADSLAVLDDSYWMSQTVTITETGAANGAGPTNGDDVLGSATATTAATLDGGNGNDTVTGGSAADSLGGGMGDDNISGNGGNDTLDGSNGRDLLSGGAGNDTLIGGNDADTLLGGADSDNLNGGNGTDSLDGGDGNDRLFGGLDNDTLIGGAGNDSLDGGNGSDLFIVADAGHAASDTILGGMDPDVLLFTGTGVLTLGSNVDVETIRLGAANGTVGNAASGINAGAVNAASAPRLEGTAGNNELTGNGAANVIVGGAGADSMKGNAGNDTFVVASIADYAGDSIVGDDGNDVLLFAARSVSSTAANNKLVLNANTTVEIARIGTEDGTLGTLSLSLDASLSTNGIQLDGNAGDNGLLGNDQDNRINGNNGSDVLRGAGGKDTMSGGSGNDMLVAVGEVSAAYSSAAVAAVNLVYGGATQTTSDVVPGDVFDGGTGSDTLYIFGNADFTAATITGIETYNINSTATFTPAQIRAVSKIELGSGVQTIKVVQPASGANPAVELTAAQVLQLLNGQAVTVNGVTTAAGTAKAFAVSGGSTGVMLGDATTATSVGDFLAATTGKVSSIDAGGSNLAITLAGSTGTVTGNGPFSTAALTTISNFGSGDTLVFPFVPQSVATSVAGVSGTTIGKITGTLANGTFTAGTGNDTMIVYDADGAGAGTALEAVVLVGFTGGSLGATGATGGTGSTGTFGG